MKKLEGLSAIVTGGGGGFGEGIAKHFAELGAAVVVGDIREAEAGRVADAIGTAGGKAVAAAADVTKRADFDKMVQAAVDTFGRLDIVVNNAGTTHKNQPILETDEATFDRVYAVNVKSLYQSAQSAIPVFRKQGHGCFVNITSTAAIRPRPGLTWYNGSKGAAVTITKSMAAELAADGIRVNGINPVMGETGLIGSFLPGEDSEAVRQKVIAGIPLGRLSVPLDIAKAAAFLASDEAEFITGVCIEVDGGRCI